MRVLFLDIDGVCNNVSTRNWCWRRGIQINKLLGIDGDSSVSAPQVREVTDCASCDMLDWAGRTSNIPVCTGSAKVDRSRGITEVEMTNRTPPDWCPLREGHILIRLRLT